MSASPHDFAALMQHLVEGLLAQSVKILFGWTLLAALFLALLMLLWDIPMVRHQIKHIPSWPRVGMGIWRGYRRQQRLHKLRIERRVPRRLCLRARGISANTGGDASPRHH